MVRSLIIAALVCCLATSAWAVAGPAQEVLGDLAQSEQSARMISGYSTIAVGVAIGVGSAIYLMGTDYGVYGLIAGGLIAVPGVVMLVVPSEIEREYAESKDSETACALALERLADSGRRNRVLSGIVNASTGVASLLFPFNFITPYDSIYSAVSSFGMAAYDLLFPSKEELAYTRYLERTEQGG